jgi:histone deacetylase complex regulatory component SIN3
MQRWTYAINFIILAGAESVKPLTRAINFFMVRAESAEPTIHAFTLPTSLYSRQELQDSSANENQVVHVTFISTLFYVYSKLVGLIYAKLKFISRMDLRMYKLGSRPPNQTAALVDSVAPFASLRYYHHTETSARIRRHKVDIGHK